MSEATKCMAMAPYTKMDTSVTASEKSITPSNSTVTKSAMSALISQFPKNTYVKLKTDNYSPYVHSRSNNDSVKRGISVKYEEPAKRKESTHTSSSSFCEALYEDSSFFKVLKKENVPTLDDLIKRHGYTYTELAEELSNKCSYKITDDKMANIAKGKLPICSFQVIGLSNIFDIPAVEILKSEAMTKFKEGIFSGEDILGKFISYCQKIIDWHKEDLAGERELFETVTENQKECITIAEERIAALEEDSFYKLLKNEKVPTLEALIKRHGYTHTKLAKAINESRRSEITTAEELIKITAGKLPLFATYVVKLSKIFDMPAVEILKSEAMTAFEEGIFSDEDIFKKFVLSCHDVIDWQNEKEKMYKDFLEDDEQSQRTLIQDLKKAENRVSLFRLCALLSSGFSLLLMILRFI